jgi:hypothetical protein
MIQPRTIHFPLCALYSDDPNDHSYCPGDHSVECESCTRRGKGVRAPPGTKPSGTQACSMSEHRNHERCSPK